MAAAAFLPGRWAGAEPGPSWTPRDGDGLHVLAVHRVNARLFAVEVATRALPKPAMVDVLLPSGYAAEPRRRYPVLYLLHGTSGGAADWSVDGNAQRIIGNRPLITVMPDIALNDGGGGWCADWPNGAQRWETFHLRQLIPWVDANLRTVRTRGGRAIAGLSQGGFCAMSYAARHPDLFATALSYSGAPDVYYDVRDRVGAIAVINATEVGLDRVPPDTFFGDPVTDGINWAAHDPATIATNLRWTRMLLYWGDGEPGPYDTPSSYGGGFIEALVSYSNHDFQARLHDLHIPAYFDFYGPGTHTWPYWSRDLAASIDTVMSDFAHPQPAPAVFTYTSADDSYSVYGWRLALHRTAREFSTFSSLGRSGFVLAGSGWASVVTPPLYRPGSRHGVRIAATTAGTRTVTVTAGPDGRLHLTVPLGPANPFQQGSPPALLAGTATYRIRVSIG